MIMYLKTSVCGLLLGAAFSMFSAELHVEKADPLAGAPEGERIALWPDGKVPDWDPEQFNRPFIEWFMPSNKTSRMAVMLSAGGGYEFCNWRPGGNGTTALRDYFLSRGVTVVRLHYRTPRSKVVDKHVAPWQDVQRAIRLVRSDAANREVDPENIGFIGYSAAGHLALLAALSSQTPAYRRVDALDEVSCHLNWAVPLYAAYTLTDGSDGPNAADGKGAEVVPELRFDAKSCPLCLMHGDADAYSPLGSVRVYERLHAMKVPVEMHVLATRGHDFFSKAEKGTPSATWKDRIWEWLVQMKFVGGTR